MSSPKSFETALLILSMLLTGSSISGSVSLGNFDAFFDAFGVSTASVVSSGGVIFEMLLLLLLLLLVLDFWGVLDGWAFEEMLELLLLLLLLDFASILLVIVLPPWPGLGVSRFHTNIRRLLDFFRLFSHEADPEKRVITHFYSTQRHS